MGSRGRGAGEGTQYIVTVSTFHISGTEVTFDQYDEFCRATGHPWADDKGWGRGSKPVIGVTWEDATAFCKWLSAKTKKTVRLPTEAEWEYAARGGAKRHGYVFSGSEELGQVGWYSVNSGERTHLVHQLLPNELGLFDMSGNVSEWCADWYGERYFESAPAENPQGPATGNGRVIRGGSWYDSKSGCRVSARDQSAQTSSSNFIGFRCVAVGE